MDNHPDSIEDNEDFPVFLTLLFACGRRLANGAFIIDPKTVLHWEEILKKEDFHPFEEESSEEE